MSKPKSPEDRASVVQFLAAECERVEALVYQAAMTKTMKDLDKRDIGASLPHPSGQGEMFCGGEAYFRLRDLATDAHRQSAYGTTADFDDMFSAFKKLVSQRFLAKQQEITGANVDTALADAVANAGKACKDVIHFVPCRLMHAKDPDTFRVGPVTFRTSIANETRMADAYARYLSEVEAGERALDERHLNQAKAYYRGFTWTAEVKVLQSSPEVSRQRAFMATEAAVNILVLLFGAYHTRRMRIGGALLDDDRRAHFYISDDGRLQVETSSASTSAVGFEDGWASFFERDDVAFLLEGADRALAPITNPALNSPLSARFVDALAWFGDAVRETADAARIIKAVTALERLVLTRKVDKIKETVSFRAAMLQSRTELYGAFKDLVGEMARYYELRSKLAHGELSPFDPIITDHAQGCVRFAERTLISALALFHSANILDHAMSIDELEHGYDELVEEERHRPLQT